MPCRWLKSLLVLAVLTVWSAATVHCGLEASGLLQPAASPADTASAEEPGCCDPTEDCERDACSLVEGADYSQPLANLKAPAPALSVELCLACLHTSLATHSALESPRPAFAAHRHPPTWLPDRHLLRRAAPPARAPASRV